MSSDLRVGGPVVFTDAGGVDRDALVTAVWSPECINLVLVSPDESRGDSYGRQIERETSVSKYEKGRTAHGFCWRLPGEPKPEFQAPLAR